MAYEGSKGWYIKELKKMGITMHPIEKRKLELYKTFVVRSLFFELTRK
ncbi:YflJ family protein [Bacillus sp. JJ1122]